MGKQIEKIPKIRVHTYAITAAELSLNHSLSKATLYTEKRDYKKALKFINKLKRKGSSGSNVIVTTGRVSLNN